jgi:hypothetical protein
MERLRTVKGGENGDRQKKPMTGSDFLRRHYPDQVRRVTSQPRSVSEAPLRNDMEYTHDDSDCQDLEITGPVYGRKPQARRWASSQAASSGVRSGGGGGWR